MRWRTNFDRVQELQCLCEYHDALIFRVGNNDSSCVIACNSGWSTELVQRWALVALLRDDLRWSESCGELFQTFTTTKISYLGHSRVNQDQSMVLKVRDDDVAWKREKWFQFQQNYPSAKLTCWREANSSRCRHPLQMTIMLIAIEREFRYVVTIGIEQLNAMISRVCDENLILRVGAHRPRILKLARFLEMVQKIC